MTVLLSFIAIIILLAFVRHRYYWRARKNNVFNDFGTVMIAHRGSKVSAPENTAAAFLEAIDYGFTYLEMDVCQLKDGTVVCSHNFDLERDFQRYTSTSIRAKKWDELMRNYQQKVPGAGEEEWWSPMTEVFSLMEG